MLGEIVTSGRFSGATFHNGFCVRERIAYIFRSDLQTVPQSFHLMPKNRGADKSLARLGKKKLQRRKIWILYISYL